MLYVCPHFTGNSCKLMSFCFVLGDMGLSREEGERQMTVQMLQGLCCFFFGRNMEMQRGLGRKLPVLATSGLSR